MRDSHLTNGEMVSWWRNGLIRHDDFHVDIHNDFSNKHGDVTSGCPMVSPFLDWLKGKVTGNNDFWPQVLEGSRVSGIFPKQTNSGSDGFDWQFRTTKTNGFQNQPRHQKLPWGYLLGNHSRAGQSCKWWCWMMLSNKNLRVDCYLAKSPCLLDESLFISIYVG